MRFYSEEQANRRRRIIGLAARRSATGIDAAAVEIDGEAVSVRAHIFVPFDASLRAAVEDACRPAGSGPQAFTALNSALGLAFADAAARVRSAAGWPRPEVDAAGLGGQTVWEQTVPLELGGAFVTGVLEAGDPAAVAEAIGVPVVSGFRAREMAAGGEGDPVKRCLERLPGDIAGLGGAAEPEIAARAVAIAILADGTLLGLPGTGTDGDDLVAPGSVTPGRR